MGEIKLAAPSVAPQMESSESNRENDGGVLPPRINQLDALALDQEMLATFHNYLADTFKFFLKSPLDYVGPEVEALLRLVIWSATHWAKGTSVGQEALGISSLCSRPHSLLQVGRSCSELCPASQLLPLSLSRSTLIGCLPSAGLDASLKL